jgi:aspartyl-tRNA(Asn)/glutamyl-tRNA(Gln) amidotransferase subunit C
MIDRAQVRRIATLANLALTEAEEETLAGELSQILGYVEALSAVDVSGVLPTAAPPTEGNFREDVLVPSLTAEQALANAPARVLTTFSVPTIVSNPAPTDRTKDPG